MRSLEENPVTVLELRPNQDDSVDSLKIPDEVRAIAVDDCKGANIDVDGNGTYDLSHGEWVVAGSGEGERYACLHNDSLSFKETNDLLEAVIKSPNKVDVVSLSLGDSSSYLQLNKFAAELVEDTSQSMELRSAAEELAREPITPQNIEEKLTQIETVLEVSAREGSSNAKELLRFQDLLERAKEKELLVMASACNDGPNCVEATVLHPENITLVGVLNPDTNTVPYGKASHSLVDTHYSGKSSGGDTAEGSSLAVTRAGAAAIQYREEHPHSSVEEVNAAIRNKPQVEPALSQNSSPEQIAALAAGLESEFNNAPDVLTESEVLKFRNKVNYNLTPNSTIQVFHTSEDRSNVLNYQSLSENPLNEVQMEVSFVGYEKRTIGNFIRSLFSDAEPKYSKASDTSRPVEISLTAHTKEYEQGSRMTFTERISLSELHDRVDQLVSGIKQGSVDRAYVIQLAEQQRAEARAANQAEFK